MTRDDILCHQSQPAIKNAMNHEENSQESLLTLSEIGARLSLSKRAVYRLIARGDLPKPVKVGGASRLCLSDLEAFFAILKAKRK